MILTMTRAAPQQRLIIITLLALFATGLSAGYLASIPQLGITWQADTEQDLLVVASVSADSPNIGRVSPGEQIIAIKQKDGNLIPLFANTIHEDPDLLSYEKYNVLLKQQNRLMEELKTGKILAVTQDQKTIELRTTHYIYSEAMVYLLTKAAYGWVALLVAAGIWAYKPGRLETRLFCLSGVSIFITILTLGAYGGRELAISGDVLALLMAINHLAVLQVWASLTALFCVYPLRKGRFPLHYLILAAGCLAWLADQMQLGPGAQHTVYAAVVFGFFFSLFILARQWRLTRDRPLERAALKWCAFSIFVGCILLISLIMLPPVLGIGREVPLHLSLIPVPILYLGLAAGLTRYRLFNLEQWWFKTWIWFFGGVLVVLLDLTLVFGLGLAGGMALSLSLAVAGWLYFPLRQTLMRRLGRNREHNFDLALKKLINNLFPASSEAHILSAWPDILKQTFAPLSLRHTDPPNIDEPVVVSKDGSQLTVSPLETGQPGLLLEFADGGRRLFTPEDLRVAHLLRAMSQQALSTVKAREDGAEAERRRIMRDLHDEVGGRILSVLHNANDDRQANLARNALQSLRETLRALDQESLSWLEDCIDDWHDLSRQRCEEMGVPLQWSLSANADHEQAITVRQRINVGRIIHEGLTNAFKHANPSHIKVELHVDSARLLLQITNNGVPGAQQEKGGFARRGLNNMRTRAEELDGHFQFLCQDTIATLKATIPFGEQ